MFHVVLSGLLQERLSMSSNTPAENRYVAFNVQRHRDLVSCELSQDVSAASGTMVIDTNHGSKRRSKCKAIDNDRRVICGYPDNSNEDGEDTSF
ncbi:hypothetical protein TNCV_2458681 [Trichonephila clavipes]|nr:hypothetical protein TNCV_2458681 [Trichonephila clavipes]